MSHDSLVVENAHVDVITGKTKKPVLLLILFNCSVLYCVLCVVYYNCTQYIFGHNLNLE